LRRLIALFRGKKYRDQEDDIISDSEKRLRALVELAPDGIIISSTTGTVIQINEAYTELTGYSKEEVLGKHFTQLDTLQIGYRDFPKYLKYFTLSALGKNQPPLEFPYTHKDGIVKWGEAHFKLIRSGFMKREVIGILRDVTKRKHAQDQMKALVEDLERSNRDLDDYTYAVSHDLKAPLRTIEVFSAFLLEDQLDKLDDQGKEYLRRMNQASTRMKTLIDELLLLSRIGRKGTEVTRINLNELLQEIINDLEPTISERNVEIIVDDLPSILTQKVWMRQLFLNLLSNGIKFNKSKTPTIKVGCEEAEKELVFSIEDNGIGIAKKYQEQIFKLFQRLHSLDEYPGTGAGLAICKKIVESFGGRIWVESEPSAGSTFYFTIPVQKVEMEVSDLPDEIILEGAQIEERLDGHFE